MIFDAATLPKGAYRAEISVADKYGNTSVAYADMVKEGMAPIISYPQNNGTVVGNIAIKGVVQDPDWQNNSLTYGFDKYIVYVASGTNDKPSNLANPGSDWKTDGIVVPAEQRSNKTSTQLNVGNSPVHNDGTIAYWYTAPEGGEALEYEYTVCVILYFFHTRYNTCKYWPVETA